MLKIVSFKICPFVQRVTAALNAKELPYEIEYIDLKNKPQWFLDISPNGQVPVLITEPDTALFESGAIENGVSNEQRAIDRAWSYLGTKHYLAQCGTMSSKDEETFKQKSAKLIAVFSKIEHQLSNENRFFKSNNLSNVDIAWLPLLHRADIIKKHTNFDFLCGLPKMQAWQAALLSSGVAKNTISVDFEKQFIDFYLVNTFLGAGTGTGIGMQLSSNCDQSSCCA